MSSWFNKKQRKKNKRPDDDLSSLKRGDSTTMDCDNDEDTPEKINTKTDHTEEHTNTRSPHSKKHRTKSVEHKKGKNKYINYQNDDLQLYVGDKILLANKRSGKVTSIGAKPEKRGVWVRVVMDVHLSSENLFDSTSPRNKTIWVPKQRVERVLHRGKKFNLTIGDKVIYVKKKTPGVIKYVGPTHFDKGVWFGVELDGPKGKNNGTVKKKFYFEAKHNHGVMLPFKRIIAAPDDTPKKPTNTSTSRSEEPFFTEKKTPKSPLKTRKKLRLSEKPKFQGWLSLYDDEDDDRKVDTVRPHSSSSTPKPSPEDSNSYSSLNNRSLLEAYLQQSRKLNGIAQELYFSNLSPIADYPEDEREDMFVRKLYFCQAKCDFFFQTSEMDELIIKKEKLLLELSEFIARHVWFKENLYEKCLETVGANLFRPLPYQDRPPALSFFNDEVFDKESNFEDPSWRHLKLVYDLTWRVINTPMVTAQMMEKYMTGKFLKCLVELFASEDHRERAYLMMILHKIYGRCLKLRPYIIQIMCGYFYRMIYTSDFEHVNGIIELLQIICAIIPGLTVPVKESWQSFVRNVLVPLHKCRRLKKFWEQLTQCCVNYVAKDGNGGAVILGGLLRFWPQQSPQKEEIFIMEVVNIINVLITHQHGFVYENYKEILVAAATKLTDCMLSTRQPVAERAIAAWKEQSMQRLVDYDRKAFLPKLCEAFYRNSEHTNQALKQNSCSVEKIYRSKDSAYWKKMQQYLCKKDRKETAIAKAIADAEGNDRDPYEIVLQKHAKEKLRGKKPKPLTAAEKRVKRKNSWSRVIESANVKLNSYRSNDSEYEDDDNVDEYDDRHSNHNNGGRRKSYSGDVVKEDIIAQLLHDEQLNGLKDVSNFSIILIQHAFGKHLRVAGDGEEINARGNGYEKINSQWILEIYGDLLKFRNNKTGRYLRIYNDGSTVDANDGGSGSKYSLFKYKSNTLESNEYPGTYLAVQENSLQYVLVVKDIESEEYSTNFTVISVLNSDDFPASQQLGRGSSSDCSPSNSDSV